jgi:uncharacterized protein
MSTQTMERAAENAALVEAGYTAFAKGDLAAVEKAFDPECVWHAQRLGALGGDHRGYPAVLRFFGQTMEMTQGTFRIEIKEVLGNDSGAAVVVRSSAKRGDRSLDDQQIHLLHLRDGRVIEVWQFVGDGPAVEAFWS